MSNAHFYLHHSPSQRVLVDHLIGKVSAEGEGDIFYKPQIIVRNQGMASWIKQRIASDAQVAMQMEFPQPNTFLTSVMVEESVSKEELLWRVFTVLPRYIKRPSAQILRDYLQGASESLDPLKQYQLAGKVAALFDKYLLYRPEWIRAWNEGQAVLELRGSPHEAWQRELWGAIQGGELRHWAQEISSLTEKVETLPEAVHVFGVSTFAPAYLQFLYVLSKRVPVHLYWLNPVEGYWGDTQSKRDWIMENAFTDGLDLFAQNPLLATFGQMGREYVHNIYGGTREEFLVQEEDLDPISLSVPETLLEQVQQGLYQNEHLRGDPIQDGSISIHACHSALREVETLKNYLLDLSTQGTLDTGKVLVMCTDVRVYAPAIEAVFKSHNERAPQTPLPFRIADRNSPMDKASISAVSQLLSLRSSRFTNQDALSILQTPAILSHFKLTQSDIPRIAAWIHENGIRWGFHASHVEEKVGSELSAPWTWEEGLERMLLGMMMPERVLWRGRAPFTEIEGADVHLLDALCEFIRWCRGIYESLGRKRTLEEWIEETKSWIQKGFSTEESVQEDLKTLSKKLNDLLKSAEFIDKPLPASIYREHLTGLLQEEGSPYGFLSGNITFCEVKPMRAVPAETICMLGMDYDAFPRPVTEIQFDLTRADHRAGDRSSRNDDLYLFLETILSAQRNLYLSYVGFSILDGSERPPSTSVQSLLDHTPGLEVQKEKLHAFDPAYFSAETPASFDEGHLRAAIALSAPLTELEELPFKVSAVKIPESLSAETLISALTHPCRFFLKSILQATLHYADPAFNENEPLELDSLEKWALRNRLLYAETITDEVREDLQQKSLLPPSQLGEQIYETAVEQIKELREAIPETFLKPVNIMVDGMGIRGNIPVDAENKVILSSPSDNSPRDQLKARLYQLLMSASLEKGVEAQVYYLDRNKKPSLFTLSSDEDYVENLKTCVTLFRQACTEPLPHFPKTAAAYWKEAYKEVLAETLMEGETSEKGKEKGLGEWLPGDYAGGESLDESIKRFFPTENPITPAFLSVSAPLWLPILTLSTPPEK